MSIAAIIKFEITTLLTALVAISIVWDNFIHVLAVISITIILRVLYLRAKFRALAQHHKAAARASRRFAADQHETQLKTLLMHSLNYDDLPPE